MENNRFNPIGGQDSYTAIWITDPNGTTRFSTAPSFADNEYVGNAKLVLNQGKDVVLDLK